ncbi:MAG TPA: hypothetical protein VML19_20630 [Verrucomicrobiae bacterium]|nr:hypothetical protein [Verrucomicrobiae bacterium]
MAVPSFNTPGEYITFLLTKLERCKSAWEAYGDACSEAYSQAYSTQYAVLKKVQKTLEEEAEQREKVLTFALSLLTVGVGGPIAGAVVRKVAGKIIAKETAELTKAAIEKAGEWGKEKATEPIKSGSEWAGKHLFKAPSTEEAFRPPGVPPDQYGNKVQKGIHATAAALFRSVENFQSNGSAGMTLQSARSLTESMLESDFVKYPPDVDPDDDQFTNDLAKNASMALWLGWAWIRDVPYWRNAAHNKFIVNYNTEPQAFRPVLDALTQTGAPRNQITQKVNIFGANYDFMDMWGFMQWSTSADAQMKLFQSMPKHPQGALAAQLRTQVQMAIVRNYQIAGISYRNAAA